MFLLALVFAPTIAPAPPAKAPPTIALPTPPFMTVFLSSITSHSIISLKGILCIAPLK